MSQFLKALNLEEKHKIADTHIIAISILLTFLCPKGLMVTQIHSHKNYIDTVEDYYSVNIMFH